MLDTVLLWVIHQKVPASRARIQPYVASHVVKVVSPVATHREAAVETPANI
jgi:hypothetical protein